MNESHPVLDILLVMALVWPGIAHGRALATRGVRLTKAVDIRAARGMVVTVLTFVVVNVALITIRSYPAVSWYLPIWVEYYNVPGLWLFNVAAMTVLFSAIATLAFLTRHPARWIIPVVCIGIFVAVEYRFRTSLLIATPEVLIDSVDGDGVVHQSTGATCGAAACANAARMLGMHSSESEMVALLGTTEAGTSPAQIVYAMRGLGFTCAKRYVRDGVITRIKAPAILFVMAGPIVDGHVVTYAGMRDDKAEIWDPGYGKMIVPVEEFRNRWGGRAIEIAKH